MAGEWVIEQTLKKRGVGAAEYRVGSWQGGAGVLQLEHHYVKISVELAGSLFITLVLHSF